MVVVPSEVRPRGRAESRETEFGLPAGCDAFSSHEGPTVADLLTVVDRDAGCTITPDAFQSPAPGHHPHCGCRRRDRADAAGWSKRRRPPSSTWRESRARVPGAEHSRL